jgi:hypothetical protein
MPFGSLYPLLSFVGFFLHTQVEFQFKILNGCSGHHNVCQKLYYEFFVIIFRIILRYKRIDLLLNILAYQNNDKRIMLYFSNLGYDVYYHLAKFEPNTTLVYGEIKKKNYIRG